MVKLIRSAGSFFISGPTNEGEGACFAVKADALIFLGSAEGEWPSEFSARVVHFSKKGSFFSLLSPSAQPKKKYQREKTKT